MRRYKLLEGKHRQDEKTYKKGDIIETYKPLANEFPGRFEDLGPSAPVRPSAPAHVVVEEEVRTEEPAAAVEEEPVITPPRTRRRSSR